MNGWHDVGGVHGFGPILPNRECEEPVFQAEWEARVFALTVAVEYLDKWNLDESRYAIEKQQPADYLKNSYYENWLISLERLMIEKGLITYKDIIKILLFIFMFLIQFKKVIIIVKINNRTE